MSTKAIASKPGEVASSWRSKARALCERPGTLLTYKQTQSPAGRFAKYGAFYLACAAAGFLYGVLYTFLPPFLAIYLAAPLALLALMTIWALPSTDRPPIRALSRLLLLYVLILSLWPNYLAIQLPGLPWISFRRIISVPLFLFFLVSLSVSSGFRDKVAKLLVSNRPMITGMVIFTALQFITLFWTARPANSVNLVVEFWVGATCAFAAAAFIFSRPGSAARFAQFIVWATTCVCVIGLLESFRQTVLWAGYIPSFLTVQDEVLQRILEGSIRDGGYRVVGPFSVSLVMAEFIAMSTPWVIDLIMKSRSVFQQAALIALDLFFLVVIVATQARLGILGWMLAHIFYVVFWAYRRWSTRRADILAPAFALAFPAGAVALFIGMMTLPAIRNRTIGGGSTGLSDDARREQFRLLWPKLLQNPFGYGAGRSGEVLQYRQPGGLLSVDSYIVTVLIDFGIVGFVAIFATLIFAAYAMFKVAWRHPTGEISLALPLGCSIGVAIVIRTVLSQTDNMALIFILLGLSAALLFRANLEPPAEKMTGHP